ncbi:hypothetical protein ES705_29070 [subsurface metagenome]
MKYLFGIEGYTKDRLSGYLENIKYGRCKLRNNWLYFTLIIQGLRGIVDNKQKSIEEFDNELKKNWLRGYYDFIKARVFNYVIL